MHRDEIFFSYIKNSKQTYLRRKKNHFWKEKKRTTKKMGISCEFYGGIFNINKSHIDII